MSAILTKGAGNQVSNRDKAIKIALNIYEHSYKISGNNSNINIDGNIYRVAAYADTKSTSALVNTVEAHTNNKLPVWYKDGMAGVVLVKQTADGRLLFFVIEKDILFQALQTTSDDNISIGWETVNKIKNKTLTKIYVPKVS